MQLYEFTQLFLAIPMHPVTTTREYDNGYVPVETFCIHDARGKVHAYDDVTVQGSARFVFVPIPNKENKNSLRFLYSDECICYQNTRRIHYPVLSSCIDGLVL